MSTSHPGSSSSGGAGRLTRLLAIPAAILLAAAGCTAMAVTLGGITMPEVQVVVGGSEQQVPSSPSEGSGSPEPTEEPSSESTRGAEESGPKGQAAAEPVPLESFNGSSTSVGPFHVVVETAYTDPTVTDGMGSEAVAPSGMTYYIYRINVTNQSSSPAIFDSQGTRAISPDGTSYANDPDAEFTVAWDYFGDEINPGATVTTHLMFLLPEGTELSHLRVCDQSELHPS